MEWDFKSHRQKYLPVYFRLRPNAYEMELISIKDIIVQRKLTNFVKKLYLYLDMGDLLIDVLILMMMMMMMMCTEEKKICRFSFFILGGVL